MAYADLLRDPRWQRKRLEIMAAANFACELCRATDKTLNVHHRQYVRGRMPWEYDRAELECLCEECHKDEHGIGEKARRERDAAAADEAHRVRLERMREERPEQYAVTMELEEIDAAMPTATDDEKDIMSDRKLRLIQKLRAMPGTNAVWRQF